MSESNASHSVKLIELPENYNISSLSNPDDEFRYDLLNFGSLQQDNYDNRKYKQLIFMEEPV